MRRAVAAREPARGVVLSGVRRGVRLALLVFAVAVAGLAAFAWLAGDPSQLELDYEGFD